MMFYPEAWKASVGVATMDPIARAGYFDVLCSMWLDGGSLPDDDRTLRACSRLDAKQWAASAEFIRAELTTTGDGHVTQSRLAEEYERTIELQAKKRLAGKKGARGRWQADSSADGSAMRSPLAETKQADSSAIVLPMETETETETITKATPKGVALGGERASAQPAPADRVAKVSKLEPKLESFGEFSRAKLTQRDREALDEKLGAMAASYIARFDRWVEEAPDGKQSGVKRKDRKAYPSILNWYDRDIKDGRITDGRTKQQQRNDADDEVLKRVFAEETGLNYDGHSWVEESLSDVRGGTGPGADQILLPDFGGSRRSGTG